MRLTSLTLLVGASLSCTRPNVPGAERITLPEEVVPLYAEAAAFQTSGISAKQIRLDLASLVQQSKVEEAVIVPFDADSWYEPRRARLEGTAVVTDVEPGRDLVVALDLGEVARNNYQVLSQMAAMRGLLPEGLRPRICTMILCPPDRFPATTLPDRVPEMKGLPVNFRRILPDAPIGSVGRPSPICEKCLEPPGNVLPCLVWRCGDLKFPVRRKVQVRRNVYSLSAADIASLRTGVDVMKKRAATDPTSWTYQARMHAIESGVAAPLQDQCQHRQFFFFSWHRMFTYYFEKILRKASGNSNLALPYWNYADVAAQGYLPEAFRIPANASNSLYNSTRSAVYNGTTPLPLPPSDVSYSTAFNLTNFTTSTLGSPSFGGRTVSAPAHFPSSAGSGGVERSPHNNVHNDIGGDMAGGESPLDPIFWLHHANVDRLWKKWLALGNGRSNPTSDTTWMSQTFTFFDENGAQVPLTGAQILDTVTQLDYRYDDDPLVLWPYFWPYLAEAKAAAGIQRVTATETLATMKQRVVLTDARRDVPLALPASARTALAQSRTSKFASERVILQLRDIQYDRPVGVSYLLFLNLPPDAKNPDHTHPNFIGTLGFFGKTESPGHKGASEGGLAEDYDITAVLQRLGATDDLRLTVLPSYPPVPADRKDLQALVAKLKPQGNPRFGEMVVVRQRIE
jgi:Common central domain of tyrosinase/Polyphenol oxidase middle domain